MKNKFSKIIKSSTSLSPIPSSRLFTDNSLEENQYETSSEPGEKEQTFPLSIISWSSDQSTREPTPLNRALQDNCANDSSTAAIVHDDDDDDELEKKVQKTVIRKLDLYILPLLAIIYLLSYLDRSNIANAKLGGLAEDTNLTAEQYQWSLSIFFFGYVLFEIPSNIILRCWYPSKWIALIMFAWGSVAVGMAAVEEFIGLLICRFLLGAFEAGLFPGLIYFMSLWYPRKEQALRLGFFWSFSALAGAFGGLLAFGIGQIQSSILAPWQLIFIIEGVPTVVMAIVCYFVLPDSPEHARFLNVEQRQIIINRLARDAGASNNHSFSWPQVLSVFTDWKTYIYALIYITGTIPLQAVTLFLPTIINGMGRWTTVQTQLMTIPPYVTAFVAIILASRCSDYFIERSLHLIVTNLFSICGLLLLMFIDQQHVNILYMGVILLTAGLYANVSIKVAWLNNNFGSLTRRAVASAMIVSIGSIGGAISGQIYQAKQKPRYFLGNAIGLGCLVLQTILALTLRFVLMYVNRRRQQMTTDQIERQIQRYGGAELVGDRHPLFRYTL